MTKVVNVRTDPVKMGPSNLLHALSIWGEIASGVGSSSGVCIGSWRLQDTYAEVEDAMHLDPDGVTASLLLAYFLKTYLAGVECSALSLLNDPECLASRLEKPRALMELLGTPELVQARAAFFATVAESLNGYGAADHPGVQQLLARDDSMALLRRDALRGIERLRVEQFLEGPADAAGRRPDCSRTVMQWWSLESMVAAATRMPSGVSLNLIRYQETYQSYFCFVVKNGGNLFVLSDVPEYEEPPLEVSETGDGYQQRPLPRSWFPYGYLGLRYHGESERLYFQRTEHRAVASEQNVSISLSHIADLHPLELVWLSMMFDLIVEKFWRRGYKVTRPAALSQAQRPLAAEPAGFSAVPRSEVKSSASLWMEDRYGCEVPLEAYTGTGQLGGDEDRALLARIKFAARVGELAASEFAARKDDVLAWYAERVKANAPTLLSLCGHTSLWVEAPQQGVPRQFLRRFLMSKSTEAQRAQASGVVFGERSDHGDLHCYLNGKIATYWVGIYPCNPCELAFLAGCEVSELPDVLQHWELWQACTGGRVDPMDWVAPNPWLALNLSILIPFSQVSMARVLKRPTDRPALETILRMESW
jgi:hypothetical protein